MSKEAVIKTALAVIRSARQTKKDLQQNIREIDKSIERALSEIVNLSDFKSGDKVLLTEQYGNRPKIKNEVYIGSVGLFPETKDGEVHYRFVKCKKDGTQSKIRHYVEDKIVSIEKI